MLRLRTTATLSALVLAGAVGMAWWMSAWPRMHDRATEAAVAARTRPPQRQQKPSPPSAPRRSAPRHVVIDSAAATAPVPPAPVHAPSPPYPMEALVDKREGVVTLRVSVNRQGAVTAVDVAKSSGDPQLDASARKTMRQWRFQPPAGDAPTTFDYPMIFRIDRGSAN